MTPLLCATGSLWRGGVPVVGCIEWYLFLETLESR